MGVLLLLFATAVLPALAISAWYDDHELEHLVYVVAMSFGAGATLWWPLRHRKVQLRRQDGFIVVGLFWTCMSIVSALPFLYKPHLDLPSAVFEAVSAITTTGATVILGLDQLPPSILFWRQELQWLGGIGVIVSAVAIVPLLGIGGMQLYRAEAPGPVKDDKLSPRIVHTARLLWTIYAGLTAACALAYWLAGMTVFDAITHSFSTLSTGGFSTHDASLAYFDSVAIEVIASIFMLAGSLNFSVHFIALSSASPAAYWRNVEVRTFLLVVAALIGFVTAVLTLQGTYASVLLALRFASLQVISIITSTGFATADFSTWPLMLPALLIFSSFIGGCAGSTAGGMKVIRFVLLARQGLCDIRRLVHPKMQCAVVLSGRPVPERVMGAVWGFFALYMITFAVIMLILMADGMDQVTAFGAVATCLNNLGPGLGEVASNFASVNDLARVVLSIAMLLGRLEIYTLLVLLSPAFWRR